MRDGWGVEDVISIWEKGEEKWMIARAQKGSRGEGACIMELYSTKSSQPKRGGEIYYAAHSSGRGGEWGR